MLNFTAITENDAQFLQVLIGQVGKDREINAVFSRTLGVLGHAELFEPVGNLLHPGPLGILRSPLWTDRTESLPHAPTFCSARTGVACPIRVNRDCAGRAEIPVMSAMLWRRK